MAKQRQVSRKKIAAKRPRGAGKDEASLQRLIDMMKNAANRKPRPVQANASLQRLIDSLNRDVNADTYRRLQAAALLKLYGQDVGQAPESMADLEAWCADHLSGPIDPFKILTPEEIKEAG